MRVVCGHGLCLLVAGVALSPAAAQSVYDPGDATISMEGWEGGATLSLEHTKSGRPALRWGNHPYNGTISTSRYFPRDWTRCQAISFWAHSEKATNQPFKLLVGSDSEATEWKDFYHYGLRVDWEGWKQLRVRLADFQPWGEPAGWSEIDHITLNATGWQIKPSPYTTLWLDDMRLEVQSDTPADNQPSTPSAPAPAEQLALAPNNPLKLWPFAHDQPEVPDAARVQAPIVHEKYFKTESALFGYYPRFVPNSVSFDGNNRPFIRYKGVIQTVGADGKWEYYEFFPYIETFVRDTHGWERLKLRTGPFFEEQIRFEQDGDAYMLASALEMIEEDGETKARGGCGLLLHSRDACKTWTVYELPHYMARFEHPETHNRDCLTRPPLVFLQHGYEAPDLYLVALAKAEDGSLSILPATKIASSTAGISFHSGDTNLAVTHGDKTFIVYGSLEEHEGHAGTASYAVTYDHATRTVTDPVLIGFGGIEVDAHNWPTIALDSRGYLHVIIGAHHNPLMYLRSVEPLSVAAWTEPEPVGDGHTYPALVCDESDTLHVITRCSHPGYIFRISHTRKKAGQPWEEPVAIVTPFRRYYRIWYHKLDLDNRGRMFLSYHSKGGMVQLFADELDAYVRRFPDEEISFLKENPDRPIGRYDVQPRQYQTYSPAFGEQVILVSDDRGESWRLAVTDDLAP